MTRKKLRRDPITGRWTIIVPEEGRAFDVEPNRRKGGPCAFCEGNEHRTPPEVDAHRPGAAAPNGPGWLTRTVPNLYPALRIEGSLDRRGIGLYDRMNGVGAHEVLIETPDHDVDLPDMEPDQVQHVVRAYRRRAVDLRGDRRFKYILIFKNYGLSSGATVEHAHSQLIALPVVPTRVHEEMEGAERYFEYKERCIFCDMISQERHEGARRIAENDRFIAFCPFASRFPFETWILPRAHSADFGAIEDEDIPAFAALLRETLARVRHALSDPSYNFLIHTAPLDGHREDVYHWHVEIMPRLVHVAGFEWGSGFYINPAEPEQAARRLRDTEI
jgi:UDPglucose--hexose-1-phosphate uridylyltransferase